MTATAMLGGSLAPLNSTMIVVALPAILADLGAPLAWGSWIIVSYLVAMAAVQPLGGRLGDRYGDRRLVLVGLACFLVASIVAALAPNVVVLIIARTAQALSGAIALPNGSALVRRLIAFGDQGRAFGLVGAGIGVAAALGPPLGGVLTETFGWRMTFFANIAVIIPALLLAYRLPRSAAANTETRVVTSAEPGASSSSNPTTVGKHRFDVAGAALLVLTLVSLALTMTIWRVPDVPPTVLPVLALVALASGAWLWRHLRRAPEPVLDLGLFLRPGYFAAGMTILLSNMVMYTIFIAMPLFMGQVLGWEPSQVGLMLAAMSVPMLLLGPIGGMLSDKLGKRAPAVVGSVIVVIGVGSLAWLGAEWSNIRLALSLAAVGFGIGLSSAPVHTAALHAAPREQAGQAAGLFSTMRYLGSVLGSAGLAAILGSAALVGSFRTAFGLLVVVGAAAVYCASRLPGRATGSAPGSASATAAGTEATRHHRRPE